MNETIRRILAENGTKTSKSVSFFCSDFHTVKLPTSLPVETVASCGTSIRE